MDVLSSLSCGKHNDRTDSCGNNILPLILILLLCCGNDTGGFLGGNTGCGCNNGGFEGILPIILILCLCGGF